MKKDFLNVCYPVDVKIRRFRIVDSLLHFVLQAIHPEFPTRSEKNIGTEFRTEINAALFKFAEYNFGENFASDFGNDADIVADVFADVKGRLNIRELSKIHFYDAEFAEQFHKRFDSVHADLPKVSETLSGAYERAKSNFIKIETAFAAMGVIRSLVQLRENSPKSEPLINEELNARHKKYLLHILLFGNLLGGVHGQEATKIATHETLYNPDADIEFSVIQYLQDGCIHPGRYASKDDEIFRSDILKHYNELTAKHKD